MNAPFRPAGPRRAAPRWLSAGVAALLVGSVAPAHAQDDFSFEILGDKAQDADKQRYQDAKDALSQERFSEALAGFSAVLNDPKQKKLHQQASYDVAKTLYRMGAYHAALARFEPILEEGPKHPFYKSSREWLFFIARKVKDDIGVLRLIAKYAKLEDIPPEYVSELSYQLGRYYFLQALEAGARGVEVQQSAEPAAGEEPAEAPGAIEEEAPAPPEKAEPEKPAKGRGKGKGKAKPSTEEGGFDFSSDGGGDDDGFDFTEGETPKKAAKKGTKPPVSKKGTKGKPVVEDAPAAPVEAPRPAAPAPDKAKKNDNTASADDNLHLALKSLERVDPSFPQYARALYIRGLAHFGLGEFEPAVKAFRGVVRMTNPRGGTVLNPKLREMAFFSLARIHYQFEQFRYALFYYERIDRDSESWLDALFESSWAHFRLGEYEKALGNLVTIQSPFFIDEYYPESSMLKAITFYQNCRYPEARAFLGEFSQNYTGVMRELDRLVGEKRTPEQIYEELAKLEGKVADGRDDTQRSSAITGRLVRLAVSDKRVAAIRDAIAEVDEEKTRMQAIGEPFAGTPDQAQLIEKIDQRRKELVINAGHVLGDKLTAELSFLKELKSQLTRIQFEITKQEKSTLESTLSNTRETVGISDYNFTTATDDERVYWPFEGEYWRDELGTYQYTLTRGCKPPAEGQ